MIDAGRLGNARHMIEHDRRGRPLQKICSLDDLTAQHMDLDMPAEIVDALRQWLEHVQIHMLGGQIVETADLLQRLPPIVFDHMARVSEPAASIIRRSHW